MTAQLQSPLREQDTLSIERALMTERLDDPVGRKLIYIMSPSFSGSTLLTSIMALHSDIATVGELKASAMGDVTNYHCSCGRPIQDCDFWSQLQVEARKRGLEFSLDNFGTHFRSANMLADRILRAMVRGPVFERLREFFLKHSPVVCAEWKQVIAQNDVLIELICLIQGAPIFLDASKDPNRLLYLRKSGRFDIWVINLTRDGRGVSNSYMKHYGTSFQRAASEWARKAKEIQYACNAIPSNRVLTLRYEDLCADPVSQTRRLNEFCYPDSGAGCPGESSNGQHLLGNLMRLNSIRDIRLDEKWRKQIGAADIHFFDRRYGKLNRALGYE